MNMNCLQSVEHAFPATILSILRQGVLLIPLLYLLDALFGLNGVIYGQSITDYIAVGLSVVIWHRVRKNLGEKKAAGTADSSSMSRPRRSEKPRTKSLRKK